MKALGRLIVTPSEFAARQLSAGKYLTNKRARKPMHRVYAAWADFSKPAVMEWGIKRYPVVRGPQAITYAGVSTGIEQPRDGVNTVPFLNVFFRTYKGASPAVRLCMSILNRRGILGDGAIPETATTLVRLDAASACRWWQSVLLWTPDPVSNVLTVTVHPDRYGRFTVKRVGK